MSYYPKPVLSLGTKSLALKLTVAEVIQNPAPVKRVKKISKLKKLEISKLQ